MIFFIYLPNKNALLRLPQATSPIEVSREIAKRPPVMHSDQSEDDRMRVWRGDEHQKKREDVGDNTIKQS